MGETTPFSYNSHAALDSFGYSVSTEQTLVQISGNAWVPMGALNHTDADISIVMTALNSMLFAAPNNDAVFGAHQMSSYIDNQGQNHSWYVP